MSFTLPCRVAVILVSACIPGSGAAAQTVRDVTPPGVTRVQRDGNQPNVVRQSIGRALVRSDGALSTQGGAFRLFGVKLPPARQICRTASGARWACGARALGALRGFIDDQAIACSPEEKTQDMPVRVCWLNGVNLSLWLLEQGWGDADNADLPREYREALASAKARRLGLWSESVPGSR
ncbi:MAG: thermonuclease family protein [Pseudorhodoplanes sp.]